MEGDINIFTVWQECFAGVPAETFHQAVVDCANEPGRKFAPSIGEIIHAIKEIPFKGMTPTERFEKEQGIRPAYEVLREMGIYDQDDEEQKIKYQEIKARKELHNEPTF
jgi:hypothetical protein